MARAEKVIPFATVPRDPDRDAALVEIHHPHRSRADIVLPQVMQDRLERVVEEHRAQATLARHGARRDLAKGHPTQPT